MLVPNNNVSILKIFTTVNIEDLSSFVDELMILVSEELEPSRVCGPDFHVVG